MTALTAYTIMTITTIVIGLILYSIRIQVKEPSIGILYQFGKIVKKRLTPGLHFYVRNILGLRIYEVVIVPGRFFSIKIKPDNASTHNVKVKINIEIQLRLKLARDGFPTFAAAKNFLNWIHVNANETLLGQITDEGYESGAIDRFLQSFVEGQVTQVITHYRPEEITANPLVAEQLRSAIEASIFPLLASWVGDIHVLIQENSVPDEEAREKQRRDTQVTADNEAVIQRTHITITKEIQQELGDKYATIYATTQALKGANVNLFGTGFGDAVGSLLSHKLTKKQNQRKKKQKGIQPWTNL